MRTKKKKPFNLTPRQVQILQNWQTAISVSPKLAAIIDDSSMSTINERLARGEYEAFKDGARTKITVASILRRRERLERASYSTASTRAIDRAQYDRLAAEVSAASNFKDAAGLVATAALTGAFKTLGEDQLAALRDLIDEKV
jgi:hypothetical protein